MSESLPAPALPPVPWWERIAAGLLVAGWVAWFWVLGFTPVEWWIEVASYLGNQQEGWQSFLAEPAGDFSALSNSLPLLRGLANGLRLGVYGAMPLLVVGGVIVASGRYRERHRHWLWWLALGNGMMSSLALLFDGRYRGVAVSIPDPEGLHHLPWHPAWMYDFEGGRWRDTLGHYWPFAAEMLLAALVLGVGWWRRKRCVASAQ